MTTATAVRQDRQQAFEEVVIHDSHLEALCEQYVESRQEAMKAMKPYRRLHKQLKEELGPRAKDKRLRIGPYVVTGTAIEGGDIEIPPWKSVRLRVERD